jgi:hypothetical protein
VIYQNKEKWVKEHYTSNHGKMGLAVVLGCVGLGMVGGIVLHPDFGIDKTNGLIRKVHKTSARVILALSWVTALYGVYQMTNGEVIPLAIVGLPMLVLAPFTLM